MGGTGSDRDSQLGPTLCRVREGSDKEELVVQGLGTRYQALRRLVIRNADTKLERKSIHSALCSQLTVNTDFTTQNFFGLAKPTESAIKRLSPPA